LLSLFASPEQEKGKENIVNIATTDTVEKVFSAAVNDSSQDQEQETQNPFVLNVLDSNFELLSSDEE